MFGSSYQVIKLQKQDNASHTAQAVSFAEPHCPLTCLSTDPPGAFSSLRYSAEPAVTRSHRAPHREAGWQRVCERDPAFQLAQRTRALRAGLDGVFPNGVRRSVTTRDEHSGEKHTCVCHARVLIIRAHSGPKVQCTEREGLAAQAHYAHYNN